MADRQQSGHWGFDPGGFFCRLPKRVISIALSTLPTARTRHTFVRRGVFHDTVRGFVLALEGQPFASRLSTPRDVDPDRRPRDRLPLPHRNKTKHYWPLRTFHFTIVCHLGFIRHSLLPRQPTRPCMDGPSETAMWFRFRVVDTRVRRSVLVSHSCTTMNCQQRVEPRLVQIPSIGMRCAYFHRMGARTGPSSSRSPDVRRRLSQRFCHGAPRNADAS